MTKIIMHGCSGKMGKVVCSIVKDDPDCVIAAGIDPFGESDDFPVFRSPSECNVDADVIIDFSTASAVPALLDFSVSKKIPVVLCTTGFSDELNEQVKKIYKILSRLSSVFP